MRPQTVEFLLLCGTVLLSSCTRARTGYPVAPGPTPTELIASPTAAPPPTALSIILTPSAIPTACPSATPVPTLDPRTIADVTESGHAILRAHGVDPLCLRWEDTDDDGEPEWLGLYLRPTERPRLEAFVLDGEDWHELQAMEATDYGLGMYPTCDIDVQDSNADGKAEILIYGHADHNIELLHIFAWAGVRYQLVASFQSDAGVRLENIDGELGHEIIARYAAERGLAWEAIHSWDGTHYAWTWERYGWLYLDRPHTYPTGNPEHAIISFYLALDDRDLPGAYGLLSSEARSSQPYNTWAASFDTTLAVEVGSVHQTARTGDSATVTAQVRSYENVDGYVVGALWDTTWTLVYTEPTWQLQNATLEELDQWEAPYVP